MDIKENGKKLRHSKRKESKRHKSIAVKKRAEEEQLKIVKTAEH